MPERTEISRAKPQREAYDLIVIGGGPAGVTAALRARELGASVVLVERGRMGGTCTNDGCVPTRVLAKGARLLRDAEQFSQYGLMASRPTLDFGQLLNRTQQVVYQIQEKKQLIKHLEESGARVFADVGDARFLDPHTISLPDQTTLRGEKSILCVGGHARRLNFPGAEHALTHSDVWSLRELPRTVVVVGAAATGCQLASNFAAFGAQVWLLDIAADILPLEDTHIRQQMGQAFQQRGIRVTTGITTVERIVQDARGLKFVFTKHGQEHELLTDAVILAVGWPGNLEGLNLTAAGVEVERNYVRVNDYLQTTTKHIFAAGDITGRMMLVQSAGYEARIAAENAILGIQQDYGHHIVPHGGFTDPEYGSVGLTEEQARLEHNPAIAVVPYADLDRAIIDGRPEGFCKLIADRTSRRILGAHVVGEQALEVVQIVAAGMAAAVKVEELAGLELAYPTFTAIVGLAARRLVRELGLEPMAPQWRALRKEYFAEWERQDD